MSTRTNKSLNQEDIDSRMDKRIRPVEKRERTPRRTAHGAQKRKYKNKRRA